MSSMVLTTSGKPLRKSAASSSPVWFQSSCCSLRTRSLFSCADIGLSLPGSPTDHNTACMMPLEDIRCTLALFPTARPTRRRHRFYRLQVGKGGVEGVRRRVWLRPCNLVTEPVIELSVTPARQMLPRLVCLNRDKQEYKGSG